MDVILVPGLWLDGSSWDRVVSVLEQAGLRAHPLTLPGLDSVDADRSEIRLRDHVAAVVASVDAVDPGDPVMLVGHSAGSGIVYAALDARPERIARAVYIGGFPTPDGSALASGFAAEHGEVPLPDWSDFDDADLVDLDEAARADFRRRAIPSPAGVTGDRLQLSRDDRRYAVPVTAICPEFTAAQLQEWIADGETAVQEFSRIADVEYVDLPTGHWPQFSRPESLGRALVAAARLG